MASYAAQASYIAAERWNRLRMHGGPRRVDADRVQQLLIPKPRRGELTADVFLNE